jgi:hypothetical protein
MSHSYSVTTLSEKLQKRRISSREKGIALHKMIARYVQGHEVECDVEDIAFKQFQDWDKLRESHGWEIESVEKKIQDVEARIVGRVDAVYRDGVGRNFIVDWKRSCRMSESHREKYFLQLNLYKHIFETCYSLPIDGMILVMFHPNLESWMEVRVPVIDVKSLLPDIAKKPLSTTLTTTTTTTTTSTSRKNPCSEAFARFTRCTIS